MRTIAVGDIHGCIDEFKELLNKLSITSSDRIVLLGDLMDKGPDPSGTVRFARSQGFEMIRGNHEERHIRWYRHEKKRKADPSYKNPMGRPLTKEDAYQNSLLTDEDIQWFDDAPVVLEIAPGWLAVHGGLFPGKTLEEQLANKKMRDQIVRLRWLDENGKHVPVSYGKDDSEKVKINWVNVYDGDYNVVYGHEAHSLKEPLVVEGKKPGVLTFGIDTGCSLGGHLTALVITEKSYDFVQVKAKKNYEK